jgi:hypothetical protein
MENLPVGYHENSSHFVYVAASWKSNDDTIMFQTALQAAQGGKLLVQRERP